MQVRDVQSPFGDKNVSNAPQKSQIALKPARVVRIRFHATVCLYTIALGEMSV